MSGGAKPITFIFGCLLGGLLAVVLTLFIVLGLEFGATAALTAFVFKWQTLFAGLLGIVAGGFAVIAALISSHHNERLAKREQREKENAFCRILRQDSVQTLGIVMELEDWATALSDGESAVITYKEFVMGESLVNCWNAFPFVPAAISEALFLFSHAMFDVQIRTREIGKFRSLKSDHSAFIPYFNAVSNAKKLGTQLIQSIDTHLEPQQDSAQ